MQPQLIAGRYRVLRAIGRGGMGTVWLCRDEVLGRQVAVKQIGALAGDTASETKRAMREARSAAALNHPNAVAVYDVVTHESRPWLVMEYVEGQTLADEISRDGQLSPQRVADIGAQLAGALARAHERGIVHRDIKPGNVLIDKAGRPKISDFGIARGHGDEQLTQIGFITGTPGFLSPELARGADPHSASDVWALGATLYSAVEGQPPYAPRSNPIALLRAIATERPRPMTHAGPLGPAIDAMMDEVPARRWDMATSAKRLGGIARATAVLPVVGPVRTAVLAALPLEPTQALEPTQRLEAVAPVVAAPVVGTKVAVASRVPAPVVAAPVVETKVAIAPVVAGPVAAVAAAPVPVARVLAPEREVATAPAGEVAVTPVAVIPAAVIADPMLPPQERTSVRRWLPLVLLALLVTVLGVVFLQSQMGDGSGTAGTTSAATKAKAVAPKVAVPQASAPGATGSAPTPAPAASGEEADKRLEEFVKSYYSDVTDKRDLTWAQFTPRMKLRAGGRSGYDGFWDTIEKVDVKQTLANASANTATVHLIYTKRGGTEVTETHQSTFVSQGGNYLFDTDTRIG